MELLQIYHPHFSYTYRILSAAISRAYHFPFHTYLVSISWSNLPLTLLIKMKLFLYLLNAIYRLPYHCQFHTYLTSISRPHPIDMKLFLILYLKNVIGCHITVDFTHTRLPYYGQIYCHDLIKMKISLYLLNVMGCHIIVNFIHYPGKN